MAAIALKHILAGVMIEGNLPESVANMPITGITADSRQVEPGFLFVAVKGRETDGHRFLSQAHNKLAAVALVERADGQVPLMQVLVQNSHQAIAQAAMNFYGRPGDAMNIIGITGTNGKTTTSYLIEALLKPNVGVIGTVELRYGNKCTVSGMTTPDPISLARNLKDMREAGVGNLVMEVSSHALEQKRVDGLNFKGAVFTNLSRDHLDYHTTMDGYFAAKKRLFAELLPMAQKNGVTPWAVVNMEAPQLQVLLDLLRVHHIKFMSYGANGMVRALSADYSLDGIQAIVETPRGQLVLSSHLIGDFNLQNLLAAVAAGLCMDMPLIDISQRLAACTSVPGRLERVNAHAGNGPVVLVDYAHTDDALRKALKVIRGLSTGRLICVFGAGGNRDKGKRPLMGQAVGEMADVAVVTSDNPRMEEPMAIIDMITPGLMQAGFKQSASWPEGRREFICEPDREKAIKLAISHANLNDVVLIAGKGHESYQTIGRENFHFDDREKACCALETWSEDGV